MIAQPTENIIYFYSEFRDTFAEIEVQWSQSFSLFKVHPILSWIALTPIREIYTLLIWWVKKTQSLANSSPRNNTMETSVSFTSYKTYFIKVKIIEPFLSMACSYLVLTKNVRDASRVIHIAKQLYLNNTRFFQQAYKMATTEPYTWADMSRWNTTPIWNLSDR